MGLVRYFILTVAITLAGPAWAQAPAAENDGPNRNIVRHAEGTIRYQTFKEKRFRGTEHWQLLVHPDGSRTLITQNNIFARDVVMHAIVRVKADFYPVESYVAYWNAGLFKGSGLFRVADGQLTADILGPEGRLTQTMPVDRQRLSILVHPLAPDGWHGGSYDKAKGGAQVIPVVNLDAIASAPRMVLAAPFTQTWDFKGVEDVTVPAGTFAAERYDIGDFQVWTMGPDRTLIRFNWPKFDQEYVLESYQSGP